MAAKVSQLQPVTVIGKGHRRRDLAPVYGVTSASEPGKLYLVVWESSRSEWVCGCPRFTFRHQCKHVDAVRERIASERERTMAEEHWAITPAGAEALAEYRREQRCRETSMRRGPQAFSLLK